MKLSTNIYQRLLWITASASLLGIVGCSNLPRTASSNDTAKYGTNGRNLVSIIGLSPTAYREPSEPAPGPAGGGNGADSSPFGSAHSAPSSSTASSSTASSGTSSG